MKKKVILFVTVVFLAVIVSFYLSARKPYSKHFVTPVAKLASSPGPSEQPTNSPSSLSTMLQGGKKLTPAQAQALQKGEYEHEKRMWDLWLATPISFFGRVVDEKGMPVPNATVRLSFADSLFNNDTKREMKTDADGRFHASGHGLGVVVDASKEGFYRLKESGGVFNYSKASGQVEAHRRQDQAATFVIRKVGNTEPLVKVDNDYRIGKDGSPLRVNLLSGKTVQGDDSQDVQVQAWTNDAAVVTNQIRPYDWRCRISVPGGGLIARADKFDFRAPLSGYEATDEIDMPASDNGKWQSHASREYFIKLGNGVYGRMSIEMRSGGDHFFILVSYVNPSGSRNLEAERQI